MRETGWCGRDSAGAVDLCGRGREKNEHSGERHGAPEMLAQPQRAQVAREPRGTCGNGGCEEAEPMARGPAELGAVHLEARPSGLEAAGTRTHTRSHTHARACTYRQRSVSTTARRRLRLHLMGVGEPWPSWCQKGRRGFWHNATN